MFFDGVVDELRIAEMRVIELINIFPAVVEEKFVFIFLLRKHLFGDFIDSRPSVVFLKADGELLDVNL